MLLIRGEYNKKKLLECILNAMLISTNCAVQQKCKNPWQYQDMRSLPLLLCSQTNSYLFFCSRKCVSMADSRHNVGYVLHDETNSDFKFFRSEIDSGNSLIKFLVKILLQKTAQMNASLSAYQLSGWCKERQTEYRGLSTCQLFQEVD